MSSLSHATALSASSASSVSTSSTRPIFMGVVARSQIPALLCLTPSTRASKGNATRALSTSNEFAGHAGADGGLPGVHGRVRGLFIRASARV